MKSDFDLIVHKFDKEISIYPIADVHFGAIHHQEAEWKAFINKLLSEENSYVILNGDLINNNTRSSVGSPFDDTLRPREQKKLMTEYLTPIKDKILCMTSGNHEQRSLKDADDDPTYDIACKLDIEDIYRQNTVFMKVGVGKYSKSEKGETKGYSRNNYTFAITHGSGGGIYTGATVNRNERWGAVIDGVDCIIVGHTHKGTVTRPSKVVIDSNSNTVSIKDYLVISCISWQTYGEYAMRKMLLPTSSSNPQKLTLSDRSKDKNISVTW